MLVNLADEAISKIQNPARSFAVSLSVPNFSKLKISSPTFVRSKMDSKAGQCFKALGKRNSEAGFRKATTQRRGRLCGKPCSAVCKIFARTMYPQAAKVFRSIFWASLCFFAKNPVTCSKSTTGGLWYTMYRSPATIGIPLFLESLKPNLRANFEYAGQGNPAK